MKKKKKRLLRKKRNVGNWFLAALSAIYLAESVLHLKYEKITADLTRHITLLDIKVSLVESWNSCLSSGRTMQYPPPRPPPTALLFESVRNPKEDHKLKPLKTDILLDDAFDFETSIAISWQIVPGHFLVTLIRLAFLFTNSMSHFSSAYLTVVWTVVGIRVGTRRYIF